MSLFTRKIAVIAFAIPGLALATPAIGAALATSAPNTLAVSPAPILAPALADVTVEHRRDYRHRHYRDRRYRGDYGYRGDHGHRSDRYGQPVYRDTRIWRGRDGRYYCRKENGTTGLLIGGAVGGLIGNELAGRGDKTLGAILGAAGGAILGRAIDRSNSRCR